MPVLHMETDLVRSVGNQMQQASASMQQQTQQLNNSVQNLANAWQGPSASIFMGEIQPMMQRLNQFANTGELLNQRLQREVDEWESVGSVFGEHAGQYINQTKPSEASLSNPADTISSGRISIGPPTRPDITHDNGFTEFCTSNPNDQDCSPEASFDDYKNRAKYETMLRGAQAIGHLDDGAKAYEHYLYGNGEDLWFSYNEFIREDESGRIAYNNILKDVQENVQVLGPGRDKFSITSEAYPIGSGDPRYPYPSTENWQKAIGAHQVWTSADVTVTTNQDGQREYTMQLTYHAEDRYNFNPGMKDIASSSLDRDNGRFEVLGWGRPFMSYGETTTTVTWVEGDIANSQVGQSFGDRVSEPRSVDRQPLVRDR